MAIAEKLGFEICNTATILQRVTGITEAFVKKIQKVKKMKSPKEFIQN